MSILQRDGNAPFAGNSGVLHLAFTLQSETWNLLSAKLCSISECPVEAVPLAIHLTQWSRFLCWIQAFDSYGTEVVSDVIVLERNFPMEHRSAEVAAVAHRDPVAFTRADRAQRIEMLRNRATIFDDKGERGGDLMEKMTPHLLTESAIVHPCLEDVHTSLREALRVISGLEEIHCQQKQDIRRLRSLVQDQPVAIELSYALTHIDRSLVQLENSVGRML